jgi:acyl carrier protein
MILHKYPELKIISKNDLDTICINKYKENFSLSLLKDFDDLEGIEFIMEIEKLYSIQIHDEVVDYLLKDNNFEMILKYLNRSKKLKQIFKNEI